jgi:transcriptional regulator with GAF, ATPase, and Fis domain
MADGDAPAFLPDSFLLLGAVLLDEHSIEELLEHVLGIVGRTMASVNAGSVSLAEASRVYTSNSTADAALYADEAQYRSGLGPCLAAIESGEQIRVEIAEDAERWPDFAAAASEVGFHSSLSTPLRVKARTLGALNLYSVESDGFDPLEQRLASIYAQHASVLLSNAIAFMSANETAENLKEALASREAIGIATGLLMGQQTLTREQAFDVLRRSSQRENRKVREIAQDLIERAEQRSSDAP